MMINLAQYEEFLNVKKAQKKVLIERSNNLQQSCSSLRKLIDDCEEARDIMSVVGVLAQEQIKEVVERLVTEVLQIVYGLSYGFEVDNQVSRNKAETFLYVLKDGYRLDPRRNECGGGITDVVSFALRIVTWAHLSSRTRGTFILDEPGKFISKDKLGLFGEMLKKLSEMLGLQFIIISHEDQLIETADVAYHVAWKDGISTVEKIR